MMDDNKAKTVSRSRHSQDILANNSLSRLGKTGLDSLNLKDRTIPSKHIDTPKAPSRTLTNDRPLANGGKSKAVTVVSNQVDKPFSQFNSHNAANTGGATRNNFNLQSSNTSKIAAGFSKAPTEKPKIYEDLTPEASQRSNLGDPLPVDPLEQADADAGEPPTDRLQDGEEEALQN